MAPVKTTNFDLYDIIVFGDEVEKSNVRLIFRDKNGKDGQPAKRYGRAISNRRLHDSKNKICKIRSVKIYRTS